MIEIMIRIYSQPPAPESTDLLDQGMPKDFTGVAVMANLDKLSSNEEDAKIERRIIEYALPRLQKVMTCLVTGKPVALAVLSANAEEQLSSTIEEVLVRSALEAQMDNMMKPKIPVKGGFVQ
jgi:hypothetical protein